MLQRAGKVRTLRLGQEQWAAKATCGACEAHRVVGRSHAVVVDDEEARTMTEETPGSRWDARSPRRRWPWVSWIAVLAVLLTFAGMGGDATSAHAQGHPGYVPVQIATA